MHYLTVQDALWINLQVTHKVNDFTWPPLEEAVNYQYSPKVSLDVHHQAARLLYGFGRLQPMTRGNRETGVVAFLAFLAINGQAWTLDPDQTEKWLAELNGAQPSPQDVQDRCRPDGAHTAKAVRLVVPEILKRFSGLVQAA